jgi:hypothetical protein
MGPLGRRSDNDGLGFEVRQRRLDNPERGRRCWSSWSRRNLRTRYRESNHAPVAASVADQDIKTAETFDSPSTSTWQNFSSRRSPGIAGSTRKPGIYQNNLDDDVNGGWLKSHFMNARKKDVRSEKSVRLWPLLALNFFMADMQSGIGPFIGVFLQAHGWASGLIGTAMTLGNVAGMLITTPIGGFIDATNYKRAWVIVPGIAVVLAS